MSPDRATAIKCCLLPRLVASLSGLKSAAGANPEFIDRIVANIEDPTGINQLFAPPVKETWQTKLFGRPAAPRVCDVSEFYLAGSALEQINRCESLTPEQAAYYLWDHIRSSQSNEGERDGLPFAKLATGYTRFNPPTDDEAKSKPPSLAWAHPRVIGAASGVLWKLNQIVWKLQKLE